MKPVYDESQRKISGGWTSLSKRLEHGKMWQQEGSVITRWTVVRADMFGWFGGSCETRLVVVRDSIRYDRIYPRQLSNRALTIAARKFAREIFEQREIGK